MGALALTASPGLVRAQTVEGPTVRFDSGPQDPIPTNIATPTFAFSSRIPLLTFQCALDGAAPKPCSSPYTTPPLGDGPHRLEVRAIDPLGIAGVPAVRNFTVAAATPALDLAQVVRALRTTEMPALVRRDGLTVDGLTTPASGTLTLTVRRGERVLMRGAGQGDAPLRLRLTAAGRQTMRRFRSIPVLLTARLGSLAATRQTVLVRDWLTPKEARRGVVAAVQDRQGTRPRELEVEVTGRCGSGCLAVRAAWINAGHLWTTGGRIRQVDGRLRPALQPSLLH